MKSAKYPERYKLILMLLVSVCFLAPAAALAASSISISYSGGDVAEGGTAAFQLNLAGDPLPGAVMVEYTLSGAGITAGDVNPGSLTGSVMLDNGDFPSVDDLDIVDDNLVEPNELLTITLIDPDPFDSVTIAGSASVTIPADPNDTATVGIAPASASVAETAGTVAFTVSLAGGVQDGEVVDVSYALTGGAATLGTDFSDAGTGQVTLTAPGTATITVNIADDALVEPAEDFTVTLTGTDRTDITVGAGDTAAVTIENTTIATLTGLTGPATVNEGQTATFTVTVDNAIAAGFSGSVDYLITGVGPADITPFPVSGTLTIDGSSAPEFTIAVPIAADALVENAENLTLTLSNPAPAGQVALAGPLEDTTQVVNATTCEIALTAPSPATVAEGGSADFTLTISNLLDIGVSRTVDYAITGDVSAADHVPYAASGTFDVNSGTSLTSTISVPIAADDLVENPEVLTYTLTQAAGHPQVTVGAGGTSAASVTIENATLAEISIAPVAGTVMESLPAQFQVSLSRALAPGVGPITVSYVVEGTVTADDHGAPPAVVFPDDGATLTMPLEIATLEDLVVERPDEVLTVRLTGPTSGQVTVNPAADSALVTIDDNDWNVVATATASGTISPLGTTVVNNGENITFDLTWDHAIEAPAGVVLTTGALDGAGSGTYTLTNVTADTTVDAVFKHRITYTVGSNGQLDVPGVGLEPEGSSGEIIVDHNSTPSFTAVPHSPGTPAGNTAVYCVREVVANGASQGSGALYTFPAVTEDGSFSVDFRDNSFTVNILPAEAVAEGAQWRVFDSSNPDPGTKYVPDDTWRDSGSSIGLDCQVSGYMVEFKTVTGWTSPDPIAFAVNSSTTTNPSVTGVYSSKTFILTLNTASYSGGATGSITLDPAGAPGPSDDPANQVYERIYQSGTTVVLTANPDTSFAFYRWEGSYSGTGISASILINGDKSITAVFKAPSPDADADGFDADVDCNDNNPNIFPGAHETCGNDVDENCNGMADDVCGTDDEDQDGDGYSPSQGDCMDDPGDPLGVASSSIYPGAPEICGDGIDQDCYDGDRECNGTEVTCVVPSEIPLETQAQAAPPLVMFLVDDSGSMDFEVIVRGGDEGRFDGSNGSRTNWRSYLYPLSLGGYSTDNTYTASDRALTDAERKLWRSQWYDHNKMYFNPGVAYDPWPRWNTLSGTAGSGGSLAVNAHPDYPRLNPVNSATFPMSLTFTTISNSGSAGSYQYVQVRSVTGTSQVTFADAVQLVRVSDGHTIRVDNSGGANGGADGYFIHDTGWNEWTAGSAHLGTSLSRWSNYNDCTWYFSVPTAGNYEVQVWVPEYRDAATSARYDIKRSGGVVSGPYYLNQRTYHSQWKTIATLNFDAIPIPQDVVIPVAHYYVWQDTNNDGDRDNGEVFLVNLPYAHGAAGAEFEIYQFTDDGDERVEAGELSATPLTDAQIDSLEAMAATPAIRPRDAEGNLLTYDQVRQNFANWFSFYRRRELTAKSALGQVVEEMSAAKIGVATIWNRVNHGVVNIDVDGLPDDTNTLLSWIYSIYSYDGTPLRRGLQNIGQYYDLHDSGNTGQIPDGGTPPWASEAEGGGCQRAFVIAMTDGYYNASDSTVSPTVGNTDSDGIDRLGQDSEFDMGVFTGPNSGSSPTLADIAMYYYENDLNRSLSNVVPVHNQDRATHQHMVTYGVAFGVTGDLNPDDYPDCLPRCAPSDSSCPTPACPSWSAPTTQPRRIDDLYHASVNGRGLFLSAESPETLVSSLLRVMADIQGHKATGASVSINTQELRSDSYLFQANYIPGEWVGDVEAKPLHATLGYVLQTQDALGNYVDQVDWSASARLDTKGWANRQIITYNDASLTGVPFAYDSLSAAQKALLNGNATIAQSLVNYLRGDAGGEVRNGGLFRDRSGMLGDIVHASPMSYRWDSEEPGVIFAGANDGMMHAFRESDGVEIFAYVPNLVFKNLHLLGEDPYVHKYFVDSEPYIKKLGSGATMLVGGLGRGGRGYFGLDISSLSTKTGAAGTTPPFTESSDAAPLVKWEYPVNSDPENTAIDPDMGYSYSQAYIVNSYAGWVVIFGNGYSSANGDAALYVLRLTSSGELASATPTKIRTYSGGAAPNCNGLSSPALVDTDLDGKVDFAYAGDLLGNLWKFDLRADNVSAWKVAYNAQADGTGAPRPLFQAKNQAGFRQPITTQPDIMAHCRADRYGYLVIFGTGRFLGLDDFNDAGSVQSVYGIWDWAESWEKLNPLTNSADKRNPTAKFLGAFDTNRQLTNLLSNPLMPETDQTIYSIDVSLAGLGDSVAIEGVTFTRAALTMASTRSFDGASGLALCINNATYGVPDVRASASGTNVVVRTDPPGGSLSVSTVNDTGIITAQAVDLKVTLLNQNVVYSDSEIIVLTDNAIDWFNPANAAGSHAGWYYDLPGNGERVVNDVLIQGGAVMVVPTIPSDSPCSTGGDSIIFAMDACTGGRTTTATFDINGDGRVDAGDLINIGTVSNPIWVAPTGMRRTGLWYTPAVLNISGSAWDRLFFSTSNAGTEDEIIAGEQIGIYYWRNW